MKEKRTCPVCKYAIPDSARFLCPYCHFELKWMNDNKAIERAKKNFSGKTIINPQKTSLEKEISVNGEHKQAKYVYRWLWLSPFLTIPTLAILYNWEPGYELICSGSYSNCNWHLAGQITGTIAVLGSALWHLTLLKPSRNKNSFLVRWHGRQALALAGVRTAIPFFFALKDNIDSLGFIPILIFVWLVGTIWGQNQAKRGNCTLARWYGHAIELPGPPSESQDEKTSPTSTKDEIESLVKTLRFDPDTQARTDALLKLEALGVVEDL
jgi:hypothetical protein